MSVPGDKIGNYVFCILVGAGMSTVSLCKKLMESKTLSHEEIRIFDKSDDFGGVWSVNKYPGAACDIPSHAYAIRGHLNPGWTKVYADGDEIQQYYARFADSYGLRRSASFRTKVLSARWDTDRFLWEVKVEDLATNIRSTWFSTVLCNNCGAFNIPKYAPIPGRERFKGPQWHTSEWRGDVDLRGKRVAIIGTGPSAAQIGPKIQPLVKTLTLYQRSSGHVFPRNNHPHAEWVKSLFEHFPFLLWCYHVMFIIMFELSRAIWLSGTKANKALNDKAIKFLEQEVKDPVVREKLRPRVAMGCKRSLFLDDWYSLFNESNVELVVEKPIQITETGVVSKTPQAMTADERSKEPKGAYAERVDVPAKEVEREFDVIIWGTGFQIYNFGGHFDVYGLDNVHLGELWSRKLEGYWGVTVSGFPNMFKSLGPNAANYWANVTTVVEMQSGYFCRLMQHIKEESRKGPYALHPSPAAQKKFNDWIKANLTLPKLGHPPAFLTPQCSTYHVTPSGYVPLHNHFRQYDTWWHFRSLHLEDYIRLRN